MQRVFFYFKQANQFLIYIFYDSFTFYSLNDEQILSCMFENDHGVIQPALFGGKVYKLPSGHAYRWVQKLCGISFLNKNQILNKIVSFINFFSDLILYISIAIFLICL